MFLALLNELNGMMYYLCFQKSLTLQATLNIFVVIWHTFFDLFRIQYKYSINTLGGSPGYFQYYALFVKFQ